MIVGNAPYSPSFNPYQRLFTGSLEKVGIKVARIPPSKIFPLFKACHANIDVLHLDWHHDWYGGRNWLTRRLKSAMYNVGLRSANSMPLVWTAHDLFTHDSKDVEFDRRMTQALIRKCNGIMVLSDASCNLLRSQYDLMPTQKVVKIYHGHYIDCYDNSVSKLRARQKLEIDRGSFLISCLGSVKPYKGHVDLIQAFGATKNEELKLLIAGKFSSENHLQKIKSLADKQPNRKSIRIIDKFLLDDELQFYYNASDAIALPFKSILNSGTLILAMSFGKPVIAPKLGSLPEIAFPAGFEGYDPSDPVGLRVAIENSIQRFAGNSSVVNEILNFTKQSYDWTIGAKKLRSFYDEILHE